MIEELNDEEEIKAGVNVRLRKNPLSNDGSLIPEVSARKATVKMALTEIEKENSNVKASLVRYHLNLYEEKILSLLKRGYDVKVMDLGTLHIKLQGLASSSVEARELSDFTVRFTPTKKTLDAVKGLSVETASVPDHGPQIEAVTDLYRVKEDGTVTAGQPVSLSGRQLKLGTGEGNFIAFVPQDTSGRDIEDTDAWLFVEDGRMFNNMPTELCFYAPEGLERSAKYRIRVSTTFVSTRIERKSPLWGQSEAVAVKG